MTKISSFHGRVFGGPNLDTSMEKNNVKGIILPSYMYDVYMHIGIILKLTRHEPIRNSWNVIRILSVAQMGYQIEVPIGQIGHVSF